jgi:protein SCO1/2
MTGVTANGPLRLRQKDLLGHPWVADFIFTRCGGPCPLMSGKMEALQRVLPSNVRLVSFTVDPDYDSPAVLQAYAKRFHADPARWIFARAAKDVLFSLMNDGFRLAVSQERGVPAQSRVMHSTKFVLIDAQGFVRGFYDSNAGSFLADLSRDLRQISTETQSN